MASLGLSPRPPSPPSSSPLLWSKTVLPHMARSHFLFYTPTRLFLLISGCFRNVAVVLNTTSHKPYRERLNDPKPPAKAKSMQGHTQRVRVHNVILTHRHGNKCAEGQTSRHTTKKLIKCSGTSHNIHTHNGLVCYKGSCFHSTTT